MELIIGGGYSESIWDLAESLNKEEQLVEKIDCANEVFDAYAEKETEKYIPISAKEYENGILTVFLKGEKEYE